MIRKILVIFLSVAVIGMTIPACAGLRVAGERNSPPRDDPPSTAPASLKSEIDILRTTEFTKFLDLTVNPRFIDETGAASRNIGGFKELSAQRVAPKMIARGIADNDAALVERGVRGIEYGFEQQNPDGSFRNGLGVAIDDPDALEANTFFLQGVGHGYLLVSQSQFKDQFLPRLDALKPKIAKALDWLSPRKETLRQKAMDAPNRLVFDGLAFKLNGIVLSNAAFQETGDWFVGEYLKSQRPDGVFVEHEGHDSSYQAAGMLKLQVYGIYCDDPALKSRINAAIHKGIAWEKTRINDSGEVSVEGNTRTGKRREKFAGEYKVVSYPEVVECFLYYAKMNGDRQSDVLARRIVDYARKNMRGRSGQR
ncbi:MAG: hypothetical protein V2A74_05310 [bacterium]